MRVLPPSLQVLYPFKQHRFTTAEGRLNFIDEGDGPVVVFLHGNPTWSFLWRDLILNLRNQRRCLALDHLGCGLSDKPQDAKYRLEAHIQRTVEWLKSAVKEPFHLVAHDWGGAIAAGAAAQLSEQVQSVTFLNTAAFPFPRIPFRIAACRWPWIGEHLVRRHNAFVRAAAYMTTEGPLSAAAREGYAFPYDSWENRVAVYRFVEDIPMHRSHPSWSTLMEVADSLEQLQSRPVQIIWGMRDWCFNPAILREWGRRLPQATQHTFGDAGHFVHEDKPQEVLDLIQQWTKGL